MSRHAPHIELTVAQAAELRALVRATTTPQRLVLRARIVLQAAEGHPSAAIAAALGQTPGTVGKWRRRFAAQGLVGLEDAARSGCPSRLPAEKIARVLTTATQPPKGRTRWSVRTMARHVGLSKTRVQQLWSQNDLKPHQVRTFKVATDPQFETKFWDILGLYLHPPTEALVLCGDEKSQCQALDRTQPGLPLGLGQVRTRPHDYIRHGTVTLFAALSYLDGKILSQTAARHRHTEWLKFLQQLERETPPELALHLIIDNDATHKHARVKAWLARHPRCHLHFTPTGSSWLNLVERCFRDLTVDVVREGSFGSVPELVTAMTDYLAERNLNPKRYVWRAAGADILAKLQRARQKLTQLQSRS